MKSSADNEGLVKALKEQLSKLTQSSELNEKENEQRLRLVAELKILIGHVQRLSEELDSEAAEDQLTFVLNECAGVATRIMWDALPDKSCAIFLLMYEKMRLVIGGCNGVSEASRRRTFGSGEGFAGAVWQTKQPQICDDVRGDPRFAGPGMQPNSGYRSIIGVPIVDSESRFCGVLNVQSRKTKAFILDSDAELLGLLSSIVSVCLYMNEAKRGRGNGEEG